MKIRAMVVFVAVLALAFCTASCPMTQGRAPEADFVVLSSSFENPSAEYWLVQMEVEVVPSPTHPFTRTWTLPNPVLTDHLTVSLRWRNADLILWHLYDQDGLPLISDIRQGEGNPAMVALPIHRRIITSIMYSVAATSGGQLEVVVKGEPGQGD